MFSSVFFTACLKPLSEYSGFFQEPNNDDVFYTVTFNSNGGNAVSPITNLASGSTIEKPVDPSNPGYGIFDGWYKEDDLSNAWDFSGDTVTTDITLFAKWQADYDLGDTGPGGGIIFYRSAIGFTMTRKAGFFHYFEAAPTDMDTELNWQTVYLFVPYYFCNTETSIGTGWYNTYHCIFPKSFSPEYIPAARACDTYKNEGKTDWFLPSKDELNELWKNRTYVGISSGVYWSSSEYGSDYCRAWQQNFVSGNQGTSDKTMNYNVRAVRVF